jgi:hypothetical protein
MPLVCKVTKLYLKKTKNKTHKPKLIQKKMFLNLLVSSLTLKYVLTLLTIA